jgi:hypothetical protein
VLRGGTASSVLLEASHRRWKHVYVEAGVPKLCQNCDPNGNRATISEPGPKWVAPTSHVGVAKRQEVTVTSRCTYYEWLR